MHKLFFIPICIIYSFSFIVIQSYFTSFKTYYSKLFEINIIKQLTTVLEVLAIDETFVRKKIFITDIKLALNKTAKNL